MGEGGGGAKILQKIMAPPISVIKIVKYCGVDVWGCLREGGTPKSCQRFKKNLYKEKF